jgi:hypothetical protein
MHLDGVNFMTSQVWKIRNKLKIRRTTIRTIIIKNSKIIKKNENNIN